MRIKISPILLIVTGGVLLCDNLGIINLGAVEHIVRTWWPAVLIAAGIILLKK